MDNVKRKVEALLFVMSKGLRIRELAQRIGVDENEIENAIDELKEDYSKMGSAINIINFNDLYRMTVDRTLINGVEDIVPNEFNKSLIKTLSVIAWKNGITQGEVVRIRGNKAYDHIKQLCDLGFITAEEYGKTYKLFLAPKFFEYFNINKGEERFIFKQLND